MEQEDEPLGYSTKTTRPGPSGARASGRPPKKPLQTFRNRALGLLARREHSRYELYHKLKSSPADLARDPLSDDVDTEQEISAVLDALVEQNLLSDERFTEAYINMRARKGYGPQRISMELSEKGIAPELAQEYLAERDDWEEQLAATWRKKFRRAPADFAEKAKQMRFLQYRGYYPEQIKVFIDTIGLS